MNLNHRSLRQVRWQVTNGTLTKLNTLLRPPTFAFDNRDQHRSLANSSGDKILGGIEGQGSVFRNHNVIKFLFSFWVNSNDTQTTGIDINQTKLFIPLPVGE